MFPYKPLALKGWVLKRYTCPPLGLTSGYEGHMFDWHHEEFTNWFLHFHRYEKSHFKVNTAPGWENSMLLMLGSAVVMHKHSIGDFVIVTSTL